MLFLSREIEWVFYPLKTKKPLRSLDTFCLSALDCLEQIFHVNTEEGGHVHVLPISAVRQDHPGSVLLLFPRPHFKFLITPFHIQLVFFPLMRNLTETVESDRLAVQGVRVEHRGSVPCSHEAR